MNWFDCGFLIGLGLIVAGVYFIYPPAALIVAGVGVVIISLLAARIKAKNTPAK
jgi:hypothetical protein